MRHDQDASHGPGDDPGRRGERPTLEDAIRLAAEAHRGQVYPSREPEPYLLHPLRVMLRLDGPAERLAAVLHDLVEDAATTLDDLRRRGYPDAVVAAVDHLTRRDGESYEAYVERAARHPVARSVKLADLADNLANSRRLAQTDETRERVSRYQRARARLLAVDAGPPTVLQTERLVLRDYDEDDLDAVDALKSDPEVLRYTHDQPLDREGARAWLQDVIVHNRIRPRRAYNLAVVLRATGEVVGWLGFGVPTRSSVPDEYDFGYQLLRRHWGQGYATEAARRIVRFAFEELGAHRVYAECDPENVASARVLEKAGLRREAHFRRRDFKKGEWRDALHYAILAEEWRAASQAPDEPAEAHLVRSGTADDVPRVAELSRRWAAEGATTGYLPDTEESLAGRLGPYWLVAERAGRVVGYAIGAVHESEGLAVLPAGVRYLEVEDLYVEPEHRARGLGGALLRRLLDEAAARGVERALVYSSNLAWERTAAFYGRHGFRMWFIRMVR